MHSIDRQLERLLSSAARAPKDLPEAAPFAVEAKVLAQWRRWPAGAGDVAHFLLPFLRRAALCACLLMLVSIAFGYRAILSGESDEATIVASAVDLTLLP